MELNGSGERYGFDETKILATMLEFGFNTFSYDPLTRKLKKLEGKNQELGNTLFIRDTNLVDERLAKANAIKN